MNIAHSQAQMHMAGVSRDFSDGLPVDVLVLEDLCSSVSGAMAKKAASMVTSS